MLERRVSVNCGLKQKTQFVCSVFRQSNVFNISRKEILEIIAMKPRVIFASFWIFSILIWSIPLSAQKKPVKLMVLGSHYFSHEVFEPAKQMELEQLVETFAYFQPTKILTEVPFQGEEQLRKRYSAYLRGSYYLNSSPGEQIGFRLAKRLGLNTVYGIDTSSPYDQESAIQYAVNLGLNHYVDRMRSLGRNIAQAKQQHSQSESITHYLQYLNNPSILMEEHNAYAQLFEEMRRQHPELGTRMFEDWYRHHRHILHQLDMLPKNYGDRILLIVDSHLVPILRELVRGDITYQWVDIYEYLKVQ